LIERVNLLAHLIALSEMGRNAARTEKAAMAGRPEQKMMRASEYLEICEENALDAYTVEDALYWHNEIITELALELNLVRAASWPDTVKASMTVALEHRLSQHASAVTRLASVLEKNEPFIWQP
jgi:predicted glycosyl hydrolase (DUF1957 family)